MNVSSNFPLDVDKIDHADSESVVTKHLFCSKIRMGPCGIKFGLQSMRKHRILFPLEHKIFEYLYFI